MKLLINQDKPDYCALNLSSLSLSRAVLCYICAERLRIAPLTPMRGVKAGYPCKRGLSWATCVVECEVLQGAHPHFCMPMQMTPSHRSFPLGLSLSLSLSLYLHRSSESYRNLRQHLLPRIPSNSTSMHRTIGRRRSC
jgi:hypothetical protein